MKRASTRIVVAAGVAAAALSGFSPTFAAVNRGDVAIVRVDADADTFSFVTLKALTLSDSLFWTDSAWTSASGPFASNEGAGTTDILTSNLAAGTVVTVSGGNNASGEQNFLFTGTKASPNLLWGIDWGKNGWLTSGATDTDVSYLPNDLTAASNGTSHDYATSLAVTDNRMIYNGTLTGTAAQLLAAIADSSNWVATTGSSWGRGSFTLNTGGGGPRNLTWNPTAPTATVWNTTDSNNWLVGATATAFASNDVVAFTNTGVGTVAIDAAGVTPGAINVSNTTGTYSFTGGSILSGTLTKSGAGTLELTQTNGFTGVTVSAGTLVVNGGDDRLGGSSVGIVMDGGATLRTTGSGLTSARTITVDAGGGTFDTNGFNSTTTGSLSGSGVFVKAGGGLLAINGFNGTKAIGGIQVTGGELSFKLAETSTSATFNIGSTSAGTMTGHLAIGGGIRANFNGGTVSGGGQIRITGSGASIALTGSGVTTVIENQIVLNSDHLDQPFVTNIGATSGSHITVNAISGNSSVVYAAGGAGGAGSVTLNQATSYTGDSILANNYASTPSGSVGLVRLGTDNALPTTTALVFGQNVNDAPVNAGAVDLNGHQQTIASLAVNAGTLANGIINTSATQSKLTINGSASTRFSAIIGRLTNGAIADTTNNNIAIELSESHAGRLALTAANTYTGGTSIKGGTLAVEESGTLGSGVVQVSNDGTLEILAMTDVIGNSATLEISGDGMVLLGADVNESVGRLFLDGLLQQMGTWGSLESGAQFTSNHFTGDGMVTVTPEPASLSILGLCTLGALKRRQRRRV